MSTDPDRVEHRLERCLERRSAQRFEMNLPLAVHFDGRTVPGFTQDLTGRGVFFYAETMLPEGAVVELTFTMPSEITLGENMPVRCRGRVLRASSPQADPGHSHLGERNGIAVHLDSYEYLPSNEPNAHFVRVSPSSTAGATSGPHPR